MRCTHINTQKMTTRGESLQLEEDDDAVVMDSDSGDSDTNNTNDGSGDEDDESAAGVRIRGRTSQLANASMTESYSEILNSPTDSGGGLLDDVAGPSSGPYPIPRRRPGSLPTGAKNCELHSDAGVCKNYSNWCVCVLLMFCVAASFPQGIVGDGNMMHFVADNLEYKIKAASPNPRKGNVEH